MADQIESVFVPAAYGKIHVIKSGGSLTPPLIFIHGMLGRAEDWINDCQQLLPRSTFAISLRGRGLSDYPSSGFSIQDHAQDIATVIDHFGIQRCILIGFSQGVLYSMAYALEYPEKIEGMIIQDRNLAQHKMSEGWLERAKQHPDFNTREGVLRGIVDSSRDVDLLPLCTRFSRTPVLIIKAGKDSMIGIDDLEKMETVFQRSQTVIFPDSSHDVSAPDYAQYISTMKKWLGAQMR